MEMENDKKLQIGIDVGGTNIEACAFFENANNSDCAAYVHRPYPHGENAHVLCDVLAECITELTRKFSATPLQIKGVGIATPGSLDTEHGIIIHAYNLGLHNVHITEMMQSRFSHIPFQLLNDADAATLGELKLGALQGVTSGCMITLGTGVGAGIIIDGKLYRGGKMRGTELGHMTLDMHGRMCTCGNRGCIEVLCSATALAKLGRHICGDESLTARDVTERAKSGDVLAMQAFAEYVDALSSALSAYMCLLDPERIVIGGGVSLAGDFLFKPLREMTEEKCFFKPMCDICAAELGDKAGALGAAFAF
ncbi:MAG: ROK family protein [Clostridia bacterium]|nr:ROK family protein [Clostridia bacterium]